MLYRDLVQTLSMIFAVHAPESALASAMRLFPDSCAIVDLFDAVLGSRRASALAARSLRREGGLTELVLAAREGRFLLRLLIWPEGSEIPARLGDDGCPVGIRILHGTVRWMDDGHNGARGARRLFASDAPERASGGSFALPDRGEPTVMLALSNPDVEAAGQAWAPLSAGRLDAASYYAMLLSVRALLCGMSAAA